MSLAEAAPAPVRDGAMEALRAATAVAHQRLESELDIDAAIADRGRMRTLLERFWGFHAVWEPAVSAQIADEAFMAPRRKLPLLRADLLGLGLTGAEIGALPPCLEAAPAPGRAAAMGSLYVLEGSTLGGRLITRRLRERGWPDGLRYFDPYGDETGAFWRAFRLGADACGPVADMTGAAVRTFDILRAWLVRGARG